MYKWVQRNKKRMTWAIAVAVLLGAFGGFGGHFFASDLDAAITVNGEKISLKTVKKRFRLYLRQVTDEQIPEGTSKVKFVRQQAVNDLIREEILLQSTDKYDIAVSDNQVGAYVKSIPVFQKEGQFDPALYFQFLKSNLRTTPEDFENDRRREIKIKRYQQLMSDSVWVTPLEHNMRLQQAMASLPEDQQKEIMDAPDQFKQQVAQQQANFVFRDWLTYLGSQMEVNTNGLERLQ